MRGPVRGSLVWFVTAGLLSSLHTVAPTAQGAERKTAVSAQRIEAVAAMLAERPAGFGKPISDRQAWAKLAKHSAYRRIVPSAEKSLGQPIPEQPDDLFLDFSRTGNRTRWQKVAGQRRGRISPLVLAECLENKGRFLPAFDEIVRAICAERTWVMPAHDRSLRNFNKKAIDIDLASSALAWNLATADYLLADALSAETRRLIRDNVRSRVLAPYEDMVTGKRSKNWWMQTTNNWNAVCLAGVTGAALAQIQSRSERALYVVAAEEHSKNFLRGFTADGYCSEGLGYWNYGFGHYLLLAEVIYQATAGRLDLLAREDVRNPATFGARIEIINGVYPAFADCSVSARPGAGIMHFVSRRYELGLRRWEQGDMVSPSGGLFGAMMYSFPNSASLRPPAKQPAEVLGLRTWFDKAGVLICRPGESGACRMGVALKGGHNAEHHNHNDVGSYVVVVGKRPVIVDPGAEVYTSRTFSKQRYVSKVLNSYGHSVPRVASTLQKTGKTARGRVVQTAFSDTVDTLVLDLSSAYDVAELRRLVRTFHYSRKDAGSLTVIDEVEFAAPKAFETAIITLGKWKQLGPGSLLIRDGGEAVRVDLEVVGGEFQIDAEEIHEDVKTKSLPTRIGVKLTQPVTKASITQRIRPAPPSSGKK